MSYILGLGLSGAIAAHYLPSFNVITKPELEVISGGPMYLYNTLEMRRLVAEFEHKLDMGLREIRVGYWLDGLFVRASSQVLNRYYASTRGSKPAGQLGRLWLRKHKQTRFAVMNASPAQLFAELCDDCRPRTVFDEVMRIDVKEHRLKLNHTGLLQYDMLVVTIPLPILSRLIPDVAFPPLEWQPTYAQVEAWYDKPPIWRYGYDYICLPDREPHRITKFVYPQVWAEYCADAPPSTNNVEHQQLFPFGKIVSGKAPDLTKYDIHLLGRYAEWKPSMMAHDVLEEVLQLEDDLII